MATCRTISAALLAIAIALVLSAPAGAAELGASPYSDARFAAADTGEALVVWRELAPDRSQSIRAAIGTPGRGFASPVTIAVGPSGYAAGMDAAGNAVVVWEVVLESDCYKGSCSVVRSRGAFVSLRPAGGRFGPPLRLSPDRSGGPAGPRLAINRRGDWVVVMQQGAGTVVVTGKGAALPSGPVAVGEGLRGQVVGLDEAGNATFLGADAGGRQVTFVRGADGSIGALSVLDTGGPAQFPMIAVGPRGHAIAVWKSGGSLRTATRLPGASFGAPVTSALAQDTGPHSVAVDEQGRAVLVLSGLTFSPGLPFVRDTLLIARGSVTEGFGTPVAVPDRSATGLAMAAGGAAVLGILRSDRGSNREAAVAIAAPAAQFTAPLPLSRAQDGLVEGPSVAIDGTGRSVLMWVIESGGVQRIVVAALAAAGFTGPTIVTQGTRVFQPRRASANRGQVLRIGEGETIDPVVSCESPGVSCSGRLSIDVPRSRGRKRIDVGARSFLIGAGNSRVVTVRVSRAARRALRRRALTCRIVIRTNQGPGGTIRAATTLKLRRDGPATRR